MLIFAFDFDSFWDSFWMDFGNLLDLKIDPKSNLKSSRKLIAATYPQQTTPRGAKTAQERPNKRPPRDLQTPEQRPNTPKIVKFQQERYSYSTNWFRPQHEFISDDCFIWRYEDSFKKNFNNFIYKNFKVDLIVDEKISPWKVYYDYCPKIKITKAIEKAVKMVYEKDYQITSV